MLRNFPKCVDIEIFGKAKSQTGFSSSLLREKHVEDCKNTYLANYLVLQNEMSSINPHGDRGFEVQEVIFKGSMLQFRTVS